MRVSGKAWAIISLAVVIIVVSIDLLRRSDAPVDEARQSVDVTSADAAVDRQETSSNPVSPTPDTTANTADRTDPLRRYSDEELIGYGINPDMREWAFRFLADRTDPEFIKEFFLLRGDVTGASVYCDELVLPDGRVQKYCDDSSTHPYHDYDDASLEQLALADPIAAQVLGHRNLHRDPEASEAFFLRAAALSGKPGPIVDYLGLRSGLEGDPETGRLIDEQAALRAYTLAVVVSKIGYPMLIARSYRIALDARGVSAEAIEKAEAASVQVMEELEQTRNALIGGNLCTGKERYV